jgi:glycosyltransferase involved in cell wall biosynthesis
MNKIFDAMLVERPVIASYSAGNDPIGEAGCGITVPADSIEQLMDGLNRIQKLTKEQRRTMGEAGGSFVREHHDYRQLSDRFLEAVQSSKSKGARSLPG